MGGLFQPAHLVLIVLTVLIVFGVGNPKKLGRGLERMHSDLRGEWSSFRGALFMAKGVDPNVGRDLGDMLPDEEARHSRARARLLLAILLGNTLYFLASPLLPVAARFSSETGSSLPAFVDVWFCLFVFGGLNLLGSLGGQHNSKSATQNDTPRQ